MTHRVDVVGVDIEDDISELEKTFIESGFSRIPVYKADKDHIIGIVHQKDYFKKIVEKEKISIKKGAWLKLLFFCQNKTGKI